MRAITEKDNALEEITNLINCYGERPNAVKTEKYTEFKERLLVNQKYVCLFRAVATAVVLTRYLLQTKEDRNAQFYQQAKEMTDSALKDLLSMRNELTRFFNETSYTPHIIYTLMDPDRLSALHNNLCKNLRSGGIIRNGKQPSGSAL